METEPNVVIIPEGRLAFPSLFKKTAVMDGDPEEKHKYQCVVLIPPAFNLERIKKAMGHVVKKKWGGKPEGEPLVLALKSCEGKKYDGFDDGWHFLRAATKFKPDVVDQLKNPITDLDAGRVYAGSFCNFVVSAYAWHHKKTKRNGVSFNIDAVQLVRDGDRLDRKITAAVMFDALEDNDLGDALGSTPGVGDDAESLDDILD